MNFQRSRLNPLIAVLSIALVAVGCSATATIGANTNVENSAGSVEADPAAGNSASSVDAVTSHSSSGDIFRSFADQLVSDLNGNVNVSMIDFDAAHEALGHRVPADCSDPAQHQELGERVAANSRPAGAALNFPLLYRFSVDQPEELETAIGLSLCDIRAGALNVLAWGAQDFYLVSVDPGSIDATVEADPQWSAHLTTSQRDGGTLYDWGQQARPEIPDSPARWGDNVGGFLFVRDELVVATRESTAMREYFEPHTSRLSEDAQIDAVLTDLIAHNVFAVTINNGLGDEEQAEWRLLAPWLMAGVGAGVDDSGTVVAHVALSYTSPEEAAAQGEVIEELLSTGMSAEGQPWSDILVMERMDVDGALVSFAVAGVGSAQPLDLLHQAAFQGGEPLTASP